MHRNTDRARIIADYSPQYLNPIQVTAGETLKLGREDNDIPGWRWCHAPDGREGWVPVELISTGGKEPTILQDYSAQELSVSQAEEVSVVEVRHGWLLVQNAHGRRGWIPASHTEPL